MKEALNISWLDLGIGYLFFLVPIAILIYYKTGLVKSTLVAILRMTVQLILVGLYLEFIFKLNSPILNLAWVLIMIVAASFSIVKRAEVKLKMFMLPVVLSLMISILLVDSYFLVFVLKLDNVFEARYFIPITGMIIGNCLRNNIISLNAFYSGLKDKNTFFQYALANGASTREAIFPFVRNAIKDSVNPSIGTMAVIGLVALPGMMTGQILGGSSPALAIKYQIMIMVSIFLTSVLSVFLTLTISKRIILDKMGNLKT